MLVLFVVIIAAPVIVRHQNFLKTIFGGSGGLWSSALGLAEGDTSKLGLIQPLDSNLNDTVAWYTGSGLPGDGFTSSSVPSPSPGNWNWNPKLF